MHSMLKKDILWKVYKYARLFRRTFKHNNIKKNKLYGMFINIHD